VLFSKIRRGDCMEFTKLSAPSLKELFIQELEGMILSGKLKVGEKLPSEREIIIVAFLELGKFVQS